MQMRNGFSAIGTVIDDNTKSIGTELIAQFTCNEKKMPKSFLVATISFTNSYNRPLWNDKQVGRCLWIDITNRNANVILMFKIARDFPVDDLLEKCLLSHMKYM